MDLRMVMEINLVKPGFNSGWNQIMGVWQTNGPLPGPVVESPKDLINFGGKGNIQISLICLESDCGPISIKILKFRQNRKTI